MATSLDRLRASAGLPPRTLMTSSARESAPPVLTVMSPEDTRPSDQQKGTAAAAPDVSHPAAPPPVPATPAPVVPTIPRPLSASAPSTPKPTKPSPAAERRGLVSIPDVQGDPEKELMPVVEFAATVSVVFLGGVLLLTSGLIPGLPVMSDPALMPTIASGVCLAGLTQGYLAWKRWLRSRAALVMVDTRAKRRGVTDPLTGLANRAGYKINVEDALARREETAPLGVVYIDLDRFKEVNDNYGHDMGDKLLKAVTERLAEIAGGVATGARLGGDEFALVVDGCADDSQIVAIGEAVSRRMGQPFSIDGVELVIGGSVGIAIAPDDGLDFNELVRRADIAMYRAKAAGRGTCIRFHPSMEDNVRKKKIMEDELRHAIERNELQMVYQPVFAADGETIRGVEALVRWNNPKLGQVSPTDFIALAEETGLIASIGEWTVRVALGHARDWEGISVAVNVSPAQFRAKGLAEMLIGLVQESGIPPKLVEIEVTEGVLIRDADRAQAVIRTLREAGMRIALDDFGTGFSSLSYLRRFEFDKLKIDQVFVKTLSSERGGGSGSAAIIHNVVALGRSLGLTVQAEGVETLEHHIFLRAAGCHCLQGYYFAKPMTKDEFDVFYKAKRGLGYDNPAYESPMFAAR